MPPRYKMTAVEFIVADMAASLAFYRRIGFDIPAEADTEESVHYDLGNGVELVWDDLAMIQGDGSSYLPATNGPAMTVAFDCGSPAEVDRLYAELVASGVKGSVEPYDAPWGRRFSLVLDPDGNGVALYAEL
ncbi:VOC family protein [Phytomonospora endophytica]|uniref:Putative glyoxalase superfamily protein PhnB n=1 Tax=Phytomonospora endophytica TaxID=714109 RepID=A0A841FK22_9ACTN|nr:VOC family protein [Phytomonospora endophytica]MBB6036205.1 putative glyoxalase superfamily protein PhnB [Phytomonospora endophytica]GIG67111.1 glyoxalase [Phytomonospora endophytica]